MSFSDDELKRLKIQMPSEYTGPFKALLARLEAAESYIYTLRNSNDGMDLGVAEMRWRKAAGKEGR